MHELPLLTTVAVAFAAAWVLGMLTHRIGLSPIVGYLLAGVLIGPHTPGYVGDSHSASQLAEIGVILLMFGVGLHFHFKDLLAVRKIAVPGAVGQSLVATLCGVVVFSAFGWPLSAGLVLGVAMSVASTVVLMRVLMDAGKLDAPEGHAAVGWLIVEDIITVLVLVLIPAVAGASYVGAAGADPHAAGAVGAGVATAVDAKATLDAQAGAAGEGGGASAGGWVLPLAWALLKLAVLVVLVFFAGSRIVPKVLVWVAKLRSRELFTLTVLVLSIAVATGSAAVFGASVALGAFLAGMVVGQSPVSRQAGADLLPLRDAFAVLFFVSVGMLFDPGFLLDQPLMVAAGLAIVLLVKPLTAVVIVALLGYPARTALTVAVGLAQIGEFSFIVSELARRLHLMPDEGHNVLVACAIVSITVNPVLFRSLDGFESRLRRRGFLWRVLNRRSEAQTKAANAQGTAGAPASGPLAVIVGYGPTGRHVDRLLKEAGMDTLVIDLNMTAIDELRAKNQGAVFGDAAQSSILEQAGVARATHMILTMPDAAAHLEMIAAGRELNPKLRVFSRARYARDRAIVADAVAPVRGSLVQGTVVTAVDEIESAVALARLVLLDLGTGKAQIKTEMQKIRREFASPAGGDPSASKPVAGADAGTPEPASGAAGPKDAPSTEKADRPPPGTPPPTP
jgi:CPA2 family monovalent cation:H+ antiporter-2